MIILYVYYTNYELIIVKYNSLLWSKFRVKQFIKVNQNITIYFFLFIYFNIGKDY